MCTLLYLSHPDLNQLATRVTAVDRTPGKTMLALQETIFHRRGGGQRADRGTIDGHAVTDVFRDPATGHTWHVVEGDPAWAPNDTVTARLDRPWRTDQSRWHSAGHLIAHAAEQLSPGLRAVRGHHYPGEGRVEFEICDASAAAPEERLKQLPEELEVQLRKAWRIVSFIHPDGTRYLQFGDYPASHCGGTHVGTSADIGSITLTSMKAKSGTLRISYRLDA